MNVLLETNVAGFDAVVLEANDPKALADWLGAHGYASSPETSDWAEPYVAANWKITAFKYAGAKERVDVGAVRMSFKTERPLFPFRVPKDQRTARGTLRVFFVGSDRVSGELGAAKPAAWAAKTRYSSENGRLTAALEGAIPADRRPDGLWLTAFEDEHWPSSGDDLYFIRSADASRVVPPPVVDEAEIPLPLDVLAAVAGVVFWIRRRSRRAPAR